MNDLALIAPLLLHPSTCLSQNDKTALMMAAEKGNEEVCTVLIEHGAEANKTDKVRIG